PDVQLMLRSRALQGDGSHHGRRWRISAGSAVQVINQSGLVEAIREAEFVGNASNDGEQSDWERRVIRQRFEPRHIDRTEPCSYSERNCISCGPRSEFGSKFIWLGDAAMRCSETLLFLQQINL